LRMTTRETGEPRQTEATQDREEDPLTNLDFEVDITKDITENQIIIMITKFFMFQLSYFDLMPVVILYPPKIWPSINFASKSLKLKM
jgi:hypothetical protein